ncbi:C45 family autoproteolytic acyltransferase/hydolase [Lacicoccus alkaliphilus]|uniref:Predicted choloylglycine hydrolase n=1 Tax=Lacicoccus alkaliphilus DSM 16010 TaxID=1123231 RepID=A0A1M7AJB8_9BACL|nr:C45 family autoproteolytic acyltransferase/hydolase [Salinicoccus alkaliphilus]SHL42860.1 Predicted choloylglycine hydrolase [Salinicoccus alkaliphilus DSM 16010]
MAEIIMNVSQFRGSHYDYGIHQGEQLKETHYMENREYEWVKRRPKFQLDHEETRKLYMEIAPSIWEELEGLQDSLKISDESVLLNFAHYRVSPKDSGCSVFLDDDHFIRNYDYHPNAYDGVYKLFKPEAGRGYAHTGPASRVTGRMDGMNEHGLVAGYNFMNRKTPFDGFTCFIISRFILETCRTAEEARVLLANIPHRGGFSYIVQDKGNDSFIAETSPRNVVFRDSAICTNHYEEMPGENRRYMKDSLERQDILTDITSPTKESLKTLFTDEEKGLYVDNYKSWSGTIHTSYYDKDDLTTEFRIGNGDFHFVDFKKWLDGSDLETDHFRSTIDTDLPFTTADWQRKKRL